MSLISFCGGRLGRQDTGGKVVTESVLFFFLNNCGGLNSGPHDVHIPVPRTWES